ncbi:porin [Aquincola sp. MAHUQ-54]|uniref:Porin n=1 Tax=Aquincola agrisoli TaxID=3119538 RepID=A0AAW9QKT9_9BURK
MNYKHSPLWVGAALACLAHAAAAQSTVTLYGLVDLNVTQYKAGGRAGGDTRVVMNDGTNNGLNGSRWGVRVNEDLGGGLQVQAVLEGGVNADTGTSAQGGRAFGRQAFIGVTSKTLGELRLGRQYVLEDYVMGLTDPMGNALVSNPSTGVTNMGRAIPLWLNAPRADNVVQYRTPSWGGFFAAGQLAPGEGTTDRFHGVSVGYVGGPMAVALSYEWNKSRTTEDDTNKSLTIGANYNFGAFKLLGGYQRNRDLALGSGNGAASGLSNLTINAGSAFVANRLTGATVGVEVPMGPFTYGANYTRVKYEGAGASADLGKTALVGRYAFSKNTQVYAGISFASGDLANWILEKRVANAGIRHAF